MRSLPANIRYLFVVLGQWPANCVVSDPAATTIEDYIAVGGHVYIEGGEAWFSDPRFMGGHNFGPTFGINAIAEGDQWELYNILGYNIAAGQDFAYTIGPNNYPDHIEPTGSGLLVHSNKLSLFGCGVANPLGGGVIKRGRTIGTSFEFGQLIDGTSPATKTELMANYIEFFDNGFALGQGSQILVTPDSIDFRRTIVGDSTAPAVVNIQSVGTTDLTLSSISDPGAPFVFSDHPTVPVVIPANEFETFEVTFFPTDSGIYCTSISIISDAANDPTVNLGLSGEGVYLTPAVPGVCYATLGYNDPNAGSLITIDLDTGSGIMIGPTGIISSGATVGPTGIINSGVPAVAVKSTGELFATDINFNSGLWRVDAATGTSAIYTSTGLVAIPALAFNADDVLYAVELYIGNLYTLDASTGSSTLIANTGINIRGLAFDPIDSTLWASVGGDNGIYTIDLSTAAATLVGNIGLSYSYGISDLCFDQEGNLYGSIGGGKAPNYLISINKSNGKGTIIGAIGFTSVSGLAIRTDSVLVDNYSGEFVYPNIFNLKQNYPNPFNPSTTIEYALPKSEHVTITVYNMLGQTLKTLVNKPMPIGHHQVDFNDHNLPSGVYFYRIEAGEYVQTRKMLLVK